MSSPATSSSSRGGRAETRLTDLARAGFVDLTAARSDVDELAERLGVPGATVLGAFGRVVGSPDEALHALCRLAERAPDEVSALFADPAAARRVALVLGASTGLADFLLRRPDALAVLLVPLSAPQPPEAV